MDRVTRDRKKKAMLKVAKVQAALRQWDPLGVAPGDLAPADEYDSYAHHIVSLVERGCSSDELAEHLNGLVLSDLEASVPSIEVAQNILSMLRSA